MVMEITLRLFLIWLRKLICNILKSNCDGRSRGESPKSDRAWCWLGWEQRQKCSLAQTGWTTVYWFAKGFLYLFDKRWPFEDCKWEPLQKKILFWDEACTCERISVWYNPVDPVSWDHSMRRVCCCFKSDHHSNLVKAYMPYSYFSMSWICPWICWVI